MVTRRTPVKCMIQYSMLFHSRREMNSGLAHGYPHYASSPCNVIQELYTAIQHEHTSPCVRYPIRTVVNLVKKVEIMTKESRLEILQGNIQISFVHYWY